MHSTVDIFLSVLSVAGVIPSDLCSSAGMSVDVSQTGIHCYGGCLTSARVAITGASDDCHDGSIMERFIVIVAVFFGCSFLLTLGYRHLLLLCDTLYTRYFGANDASLQARVTMK